MVMHEVKLQRSSQGWACWLLGDHLHRREESEWGMRDWAFLKGCLRGKGHLCCNGGSLCCLASLCSVLHLQQLWCSFFTVCKENEARKWMYINFFLVFSLQFPLKIFIALPQYCYSVSTINCPFSRLFKDVSRFQLSFWPSVNTM